jgi:hypothetical protein
MPSRRERKARREADSAELVALAAAFKRMSKADRLAQARRSDLTDNEQLALAAFSDDLDVSAALLENPAPLSSAAEGLIDANHRDRKGVRGAIQRWMEASPWHPVWASAGFAVFGACLAVWPSTFASHSRSASGNRFFGVVGLVVFGGVAVWLLVRRGQGKPPWNAPP